MFIFIRVFPIDFFMLEEGEGPNTLGDLNTPQEESNKLKVKT
jgi:hypothetical protein